MRFGIDVSEFQLVDYATAVKSGGVKFAIVRAGYGREAAQRDDSFEKHYAGLRAQLVPIGAYQYSYATSVSGVEKEAAAMLSWCRGKSFELPLYIDMEESKIYDLGWAVCTAMALRWCQLITEAGYKAGVYASSSWFNSVLNMDAIKEAGYSVWIADWGRTQPSGADIWQFGGETNLLRSKQVTGVAGTCDQNYLVNEAILGASVTVPTKVKKEVVHVELTQLEHGARGAQVKAMQALLIANGHSCGSAGADGVFGDGTLAGVKSYQVAHKLSVDGICGKQTWTMLLTGERV